MEGQLLQIQHCNRKSHQLYLCHHPVAFFLLCWKKMEKTWLRSQTAGKSAFEHFSNFSRLEKKCKNETAQIGAKTAQNDAKTAQNSGNHQKRMIFLKTTCFLPNGKNYCSFGKQHFFRAPGWYRYMMFPLQNLPATFDYLSGWQPSHASKIPRLANRWCFRLCNCHLFHLFRICNNTPYTDHTPFALHNLLMCVTYWCVSRREWAAMGVAGIIIKCINNYFLGHSPIPDLRHQEGYFHDL